MGSWASLCSLKQYIILAFLLAATSESRLSIIIVNCCCDMGDSVLGCAYQAHTNSIGPKRSIGRINRLLPTKAANQNTYHHVTLTVRRLPTTTHPLFDAPAATHQPTPSHIWHLINIHRAHIALAGRPYPPLP